MFIGVIKLTINTTSTNSMNSIEKNNNICFVNFIIIYFKGLVYFDCQYLCLAIH